MNFRNLIHTGEQITDEPYMLSSQVSQVFYVSNERHPDWCYANLIAFTIVRVVDRVALRNMGSNHKERHLFEN